jgi:Zn-dependent protease with chaperone function/uncharacterized tellurite resistance protein B-like protein
MPINWEDVRYRGDAADVKELFETYRVGDYLQAFEENSRQQDLGLRERLLKDGIRLTESLSPRIYRMFGDVCRHLELNAQGEIFCLPSAEINAFAALDVRSERTFYLVGVTARALEDLEDAELKSILGHELAHFLYRNNRLNALISTDQNNPAATVLPPLGESLFLRWRKKAEISSDRAGLLASRDFESSARALIKATFGLGPKNLNLDIGSLLEQVNEIEGRPELIESVFASHPVLPIRLKALELFSCSAKAARNGFPVSGTPLEDDRLEDGVDHLVQLTRRYPDKPLHREVMHAVSLAGALLLGADGDVSDDEVKILVQILHHYFTDEPEKEITTDRGEIEERLPKAAAVIKAEGNDDEKSFVLSRLADIALADGALVEAEGTVILHVAELLGVPGKTAYAIMVGAAQAVGFRTDVKLNRIAERLRKSLMLGFGRGIASPETRRWPPS